MMPTQASQLSRRACRSGRIWRQVLLEEDQVGDDDVGRRDIGRGAGEGGGVLGPFGGGVDRDGEAGEVFRQTVRDALGGACGVGVEGDDDKAVEAVRGVFRSGDV